MTEHSALLPCVGVEGTPGSVSARCATPRKPPNASWALPPAHSPSRSPRPPSCNSICCFKKIKAFLKNVVHGIRLLNGPMVESTLARIQICSDPNPREQLKKIRECGFQYLDSSSPRRKALAYTENGEYYRECACSTPHCCHLDCTFQLPLRAPKIQRFDRAA